MSGLTGRSKVAVVVSAFLVVLAVVMGAARLWSYVGERSETDRRLTAIAEQNQANGEQIKQALDLILSVTGPEAAARSAAGTRDILQRNAVETDCRSRRQQVRLPAPDPALPCSEQTDPSVYPGIPGQPAR